MIKLIINTIFNEKKYVNNKYKNEIILTVEISDKNIGEDIYFLDNRIFINEKENISFQHDNLKELNKSNTKIFIDDEIYEFTKSFKPKKEGNYIIKIILNFQMKDCSYMFYDCESIKTIDLSSFDGREVIDMSYMFSYCSNLKDLKFGSIDTSNVTNMSYMFCHCKELETLNLLSLRTDKVTAMEEMFCGCINLKTILFKFKTGNLINMNEMFSFCENLEDLDLSSFNLTKINKMNDVFSCCSNLKTIKVNHLSYSKFKDRNEEIEDKLIIILKM